MPENALRYRIPPRSARSTSSAVRSRPHDSSDHHAPTRPTKEKGGTRPPFITSNAISFLFERAELVDHLHAVRSRVRQRPIATVVLRLVARFDLPDADVVEHVVAERSHRPRRIRRKPRRCACRRACSSPLCRCRAARTAKTTPCRCTNSRPGTSTCRDHPVSDTRTARTHPPCTSAPAASGCP